MVGQNSEEAAELVATIRGEHVVMKNWFMGATQEATTLRDKYGPYPGLWKEVLNWPGWKEARKEYLKFHQTGGKGAPVPRKRRSRWGVANESSSNGAPSQKRRSRWGSDGPAPAAPSSMHIKPLPGLGLPGMPTNLGPQQQQEFRNFQTRLRDINVKLDNLETEAARVDALPRGHRERSPSPPPVYGADGKRKNTRAVRWRQRLTAERQDVLEKLMNLNPATRQSGLFRRKRTKKVRIPVEEHPQYNFIGLIIGPRGKTQKELEAKTGCKIAIRGRGSVKEGARGRRDGKVMESDDEPLHVVISGDDQRSVDAATDMIEQMLVVIDDEKNVHKQQQLRELALLNGTLKEDEFCQICAEKGHRSFECPKRFSMKKSAVQIRCAICGDTSHPTRDCTMKPEQQQANSKEMDSDYMSFMAELDGKKVENKPPPGPPGAPNTPAPVGGNPPSGSPPFPKGPSNLPPVPPVPPTGGPPPPPVANLPPPPLPSGLPPSAQPPGRNYYGNQQTPQQQQYGNQNYQQQSGNYYGNQQQQQTPYGNQSQQQGYQQQNQGSHQQPATWNETQGWDYQSYYGAGGHGGDAGGAGGFNWWDN